MLLDFGQCKALSAARQAALARLVIAMDRGWPADIARATKARCSGLHPVARCCSCQLRQHNRLSTCCKAWMCNPHLHAAEGLLRHLLHSAGLATPWST